VRFLCDQNFNRRIRRGLKRRRADLDVIRVQEVGLSMGKDEALLDFAAREGRVILTHDIRTMPKFARDRIKSGVPMTGLVIVPEQMPIGSAVGDLLVIVECTEPWEWDGRIEYLPL